MFTVEIRKKNEVIDRIECNTTKVVVGKSRDADIVLKGWSVGEKHACFYDCDDGVYILDLKSTSSGVKVNGQKTDEYGPIQVDDQIDIAGTTLGVVAPQNDLNSAAEQTPPQKEILRPEPAKPETHNSRDQHDKESVALDPEPVTPQKAAETPEKKAVSAAAEADREGKVWRAKLHEDLLIRMDLRRVNIKNMDDDEVLNLTKKILTELVGEYKNLPKTLNKDLLVKLVLDEAIGLGPLEDLIADDAVSEIMVNCADEIFYEKNGQLEKSDISFTNDRAVTYAIERIVSPLGRRIDESSPMVDARLKDGSRVNAVIPPLALKGPNITIRKFMKDKLTAKHLLNFGSVSQPMVEFIELVVKNKQNVVVSGGTGSGKTTLLNICSNFIPDNERIVTVEDAAELKLYQPNLIALEARPANQEGKGAIPIRDLVKNCLRMRPDRIIVGECRGGEALDMLQAMNTGHDGSLTTAHANSPRDCISRIEVMVMMAGLDLPVLAIREQISSAVQIIIQQTRFSCGSRKVTSICEVAGIENGIVQLAEIFKFNQTGRDEKGKVVGEYVATGLVPKICEDLRRNGTPVDLSVFKRTSDGSVDTPLREVF